MSSFSALYHGFHSKSKVLFGKKDENKWNKVPWYYRQLGLNVQSSRQPLQSPQPEKQTGGWQMQIFTGSILLRCLSFETSAILPIYMYRTRARLNGGLMQETNLTGLASTGEVSCVVTEAASSNQNQEPSY